MSISTHKLVRRDEDGSFQAQRVGLCYLITLDSIGISRVNRRNAVRIESRLGDPSLRSSPPRTYALREKGAPNSASFHEGKRFARVSLEAQKERLVLQIVREPQQ